ncbi:MAG: hypothetical protein GF409_07585 [Candidatus Omnitrophica bacterium]|nr:hypothetical protein [Candidatus Omnitrophota bacterium]
MNKKEDKQKYYRQFDADILRKSERMKRARRKGDRSMWFGLGMMGIIGWSVVIPTLLGVALGLWLDIRFRTRISWTLTFLVLGVALGSLNAWFWVKRERKMIEEERKS